MEIASVREARGFSNNTSAITPYTLRQVLLSYSTKEEVEDLIAQASLEPGQVNLTAYAKKTDLPSRLSQLTNDADYIQAINGMIPSSYLPSYVEDVLEFQNRSSFPSQGESGKIYIDISTNITWRWGGSSYIEIGRPILLGTTSETAFRGDYGQLAYDHISINGNPHNTRLIDLGLLITEDEINYLSGLNKNIIIKFGEKLNLSGGTLTGFLTLHNDPTSNMHAATKKYVDDNIAGISVSVTQNVTDISDLKETASSIEQTLGMQATTLTEVTDNVSGLSQTTANHTQAINQIETDVAGITTDIGHTSASITILEATVNQLAVDIEYNNIIIVVDKDNHPIYEDTLTINYTPTFRGLPMVTPPTITITTASEDIEYSYNDTSLIFNIDPESTLANKILFNVEFRYVDTVPYVVNKTIIVNTVQKGEDGVVGVDGISITSIQEEYYRSTSNTELTGGSWISIYPGWSENTYIWTRTTINYSNNTSETTAPICVTGSTGTTGATGNDGVSITRVDLLYYLSSSQTSLVGGSWDTATPTYEEGKYIWSKTKTYFSDGTNDESAPVCITGPKGEDAAYIGTTPPENTDMLWLDTSSNMLRNYVETEDGGVWEKVNDVSGSLQALNALLTTAGDNYTTLKSDFEQYCSDMSMANIKLAIKEEHYTKEETDNSVTHLFTDKEVELTSTMDGKINEAKRERESFIRLEEGPVISLGILNETGYEESTQQYTLKIHNDKICIHYGTAIISSWIQDIFQASEIDIQTPTLPYKFAFVIRTNGSLSLRRVVNDNGNV